MPSCYQRVLLLETDEGRPAKNSPGIPHVSLLFSPTTRVRSAGKRFRKCAVIFFRSVRIRNLVCMIIPCVESPSPLRLAKVVGVIRDERTFGRVD
jgi:hypothetical protein